MKTARIREAGFTLIELLTVIAILGILAAITAGVVPGVLRRAKIASTVSTFKQVETALAAYAADNNATYPPGYGYLSREAHGELPNSVFVDELRAQGALFHTDPYLSFLGKFGSLDLHDNWSESVDTNLDGFLYPLEFSPMGIRSGVDRYVFTPELYFGNNLGAETDPPVLNSEVDQQLRADSRPFVYLAVNKRQVKKMAEFWFSLDRFDPRPREGDPVSPLADMRFPPPSYDAYVLISVGPQGTTRGLLDTVSPRSDRVFPDSYFADLQSDDYWYHAMGLFAYFMASRDADDNGELDFEYKARTKGEAKNPNNWLPGDARDDVGPLIYVSR